MAQFRIDINEKISNALAGETISKGQIVYLGLNSKWYVATAGLKSKSTTELMIALEDGVENEGIDLLNYGFYEFADSILIPNQKYYLSIINGEVTTDKYINNNYTIRYIGTAFSNNTILFNPDQTYFTNRATQINDIPIGGNNITNTSDIEFNDGEDGSSRYIQESEIVFQNDIVVSLSPDVSFGKYKNGDIIPSTGMTPNEVIIMANTEVQNPTFVAPTMTSTGSVTGTREVGESVQMLLTTTFNRGRINGKLNGTIWEPSTKQADRAGEVDYYSFEGVNNGLTNNKTIPHITTLGTNTFTTAVNYLMGPQPLDSNGGNFSTPLAAGQLTRTVNYTGSLRRFFGPSNVLLNPRTLTSVFNNISDSTTFDLMTGTTENIFHILLPVGKILDIVLSVEAFNLDITDEYILQPSIQIPDANGVNRTYNHYKMTGDSPYGTNSTHRIKVKNG